MSFITIIVAAPGIINNLKIVMNGDKNVFNEETMQSLSELGEILLKVHRRLVKEGKVKVVNGKPVFITEDK